MRQLLLLTTILFFGLSLTAQQRAKSPFNTTTQTVGLTDITVEYSRPGLKDRAAFEKDSPLAPLGQLWRTGANATTMITFSNDVKVGGQDLPAGQYAVLTMPGADQWKIHFYTPKEGYWIAYTNDTPVAAAEVATRTVGDVQETFLISFDQLKDYSAHLVLSWSTTRVHVPIEVN